MVTRWLGAIVLVVLSGAAPLVGFRGQSATTDLSETDRRAIAERIHSLVLQYFAHWEGASRADMESAYGAYVDAASRSATRKDFTLATLRFIAALKNGHTQFFDPSLDGRPLKFRLLEV